MNSKSILIALMIIFFSMSSVFDGSAEEGVEEVVSMPNEYEKEEVGMVFEDKKTTDTALRTDDLNEEGAIKEVFRYGPLSNELKNKIMNNSWKSMAPYSIDDLSYIEVTYFGFDEKPHVGELIMHKMLAPEIIEIFQELYENKFPIEKMILIDEYNADDIASMSDNNSSALCVRGITNRENELSRHAYGVAIDINPIQNPYISSDTLLPKEGEEYIDRSDIRKGMIVEGDVCYQAFVSRGWTWGGNWNTIKDYQHFQKDIDIQVTKDIPDISEKQISKLVKNALQASFKVKYPQGDNRIEDNGNVYISYPTTLNSKFKMMSFLREYYTNEAAEKVYGSTEIIDMNNKIYGLQKEIDTINFDIYDIQETSSQDDNRIRRYNIEDSEGGLLYIEVKYIGSQGWRVNKIQPTDIQ